MAIRVNGELITDEEISAEMAAMREKDSYPDVADPIERNIQLKRNAEQRLAGESLMRAASRQANIVTPAQLEDHTRAASESVACRSAVDTGWQERVKRTFLLKAYLEVAMAGASAPKKADVVAYYKKHKDQFWTAELLRASHIIKNVDEISPDAVAGSAIAEAEAALKSGSPFSEVADKYSDCKGNGGDLGYFLAGQMVPEFDAVVFALRMEEVSSVFKTPFGYHIVRLTGRVPEGILPLNQVWKEIEIELLGQRREEALVAEMKRLLSTAIIEKVRT